MLPRLVTLALVALVSSVATGSSPEEGVGLYFAANAACVAASWSFSHAFTLRMIRCAWVSTRVTLRSSVSSGLKLSEGFFSQSRIHSGFNRSGAMRRSGARLAVG